MNLIGDIKLSCTEASSSQRHQCTVWVNQTRFYPVNSRVRRVSGFYSKGYREISRRIIRRVNCCPADASCRSGLTRCCVNGVHRPGPGRALAALAASAALAPNHRHYPFGPRIAFTAARCRLATHKTFCDVYVQEARIHIRPARKGAYLNSYYMDGRCVSWRVEYADTPLLLALVSSGPRVVSAWRGAATMLAVGSWQPAGPGGGAACRPIIT